VARDHRPELVFVTPAAQAGFGHELDVVGANGRVALYRYLGQGFAICPHQGGLVTYVPGWTEQDGPATAYDQMYLGYSGHDWYVVSEQYVPDAFALAQHHAPFYDPEATLAS
jgi:hypothetical protein